jgi:hypothetical protein
VRADLAVHHRLREVRLVLLVVAVTAVAPQVDHHIDLELLSESDRQLRRVHDRFGIIPVHVEDRRLDRLGHVGRVRREALLVWWRGEADLVVDDDVDRPARAPALKLRQVQGLGDDALPGERGVAVHAHRHDARAPGVAEDPLLAADDPLHDRVHQLQVRWVRHQRHLRLQPVRQRALVGVAQVVFHVAVAHFRRQRGRAHEFGQHRFVRLVEHVRQHVQPPAMGHVHDDLLGADLGAVIDQRVEQRDQRFGPFQAEALGADEHAVQVLLELLGNNELKEDFLLLLVRELRAVEDRLHTLQEPLALIAVGDVDELHADAAAIGIAQFRQQVAQRAVGRTVEAAAPDDAIQVRLRHPEVVQVQQRMIRPIVAKRIEVGDEVTQLAIAVNQVEYPHRQRDGSGNVRAGGGLLGRDLGRSHQAGIEAGEERLPLLAHRARVLAIALVNAIDVFGVGTVGQVKRLHGR